MRFDMSHATNLALARAQRRYPALLPERRGALSVWIKSLVGDEQIFYAQLRHGVMNTQEKDAFMAALVEVRREAASANGPPDAVLKVF